MRRVRAAPGGKISRLLALPLARLSRPLKLIDGPRFASAQGMKGRSEGEGSAAQPGAAVRETTGSEHQRSAELSLSGGMRALAILYGVATHLSFLGAVTWMAHELHNGLQGGLGRLQGPAAWSVNLLLALQFPLLHSSLLTRPGRAWLARLAPAAIGRHLVPTTYAWSAALQLLLTFLCWSPSGIVLYQPHGPALVVANLLFLFSGLFLGKALWDGNLGLQTGWLGWSALAQGRRPSFPGLSQHGLFALLRQPIYLGFGALLLTGPTWTPDHLLLSILWVGYCLIGPLHKESRFETVFGAAFREYRQRTPYMLPRPRQLVRALKARS